MKGAWRRRVQARLAYSHVSAASYPTSSSNHSEHTILQGHSTQTSPEEMLPIRTSVHISPRWQSYSVGIYPFRISLIGLYDKDQRMTDSLQPTGFLGGRHENTES